MRLRHAVVLSSLALASLLASAAPVLAEDTDFIRVPVGAASGPAAPASKYVLWNVYWADNEVVWHYNPAGAPAGLSVAHAVETLEAAFGKWSAVCGIRFVYGGVTATRARQGDDVSVVTWDAGMSASGLTLTTYYANRQIADSDVTLNARQVLSTQLLDAVVTHEAGHVVGLDHSDVQDAVMAGPPFTSYNNVAFLGALRDDDVAGCRAMYGMPDANVAVEFYHAGLDHYFMSANPAEIGALDDGRFAGWQRTGYSFAVIGASSPPPAGAYPVCRFYGRPEAGLDSHFYSASPAECSRVEALYATSWLKESSKVFQMFVPNPTTGACPGGTRPVYRVFNRRSDANHRYTTSTAVVNQMVARGGMAEGYGPGPYYPVMCAPQ